MLDLLDHIGGPLVQAKGHIIVDLLDDRGRVVDRQEGDNYVNAAMIDEYAKAVQKATWLYGYQGSAVTARAVDGRDPRTIPGIRNDVIALWTDTTAEDAADEFAFGEVIGWAHRWPQGSPQIRQGVVQPTLCTLTEDAVAWVWEWPTANGNGTFQSVGWRRLGWGNTAADWPMYDMPWPTQRLVTATGFADAISGGFAGAGMSWTVGTTTIHNQWATYYNSADTSIYKAHLTPTGSNIKLVRAPVTFDAFNNYNVGAVVDESANAIAAGLKVNNLATSTATCLGLTRLGASGDWISVGYTGVTGARRPYIARVTAAGSTTYTNANAGTYTTESGFLDVTYDGTDLWVTAWRGDTGVAAIHKISAATGTISATISAVTGVPAYFALGGGPTWSTTSGVCGIEWDPNLGCLWVTSNTNASNFIYNISTSGVWGGVLLRANPTATATITGLQTAPNTGVVTGYSVVDNVYMFFGDSVMSNLQTAPHSLITSTLGAELNGLAVTFTRLFTMNGGICVIVSGGVNLNVSAAWNTYRFDAAPNFASRTLLAAPVVKSVANSLRVKYTMTFS